MRWLIGTGIIWAVLAVFSSPTAWAGDQPVLAEKVEKDGHGAEKKTGETGGAHPPQADSPFQGALDLTIWSMVVFLLLLAILYQFAWPQVREGLDKREHVIASAMEEAKKAREEAVKLREQLQQDQARAQDQVRQMIDKARQDAESVAADTIARGKLELQAERDRLQREMQTTQEQNLQAIWSQGAQLGTLIASRLIHKTLSADDHRQLIDAALAEFRQAAEERKRDYLSVRA
jgi:F-type H+-transporting ATPase subunit b